MNSTIIAIIVAGALVAGAIMISQVGALQTDSADVSVNNVTVVDGKQIIQITAKGGYQPRQSIAKAGTPTILRFNTQGTFDCTSAVRIPSMNISKNLPPSGITDIDLGTQKVGMLQGTCGMGMFPFEIEFKS